MFRSLENLIGYRIAAVSGDIGTAEDFRFTDDDWCLRSIVVAVGGWLGRRPVLLAIGLIDRITDEKRELVVKITQEADYARPDTESDRTVSRQKEVLWAECFGWKPYWTPDPVLGVGLGSECLEIDAELPARIRIYGPSAK
jgi:PRC-barrel domain